METLVIIRELLTENMKDLKDMVTDREQRRELVKFVLLWAFIIISIIFIGGEPI